MNPSATREVDAGRLVSFVQALFERLGADSRHAWVVGDSLVSADLEGVASHGVMLLPMYVERIQAGSVSATAEPVITDDLGALVVMTARDGLGQVSSQVAVELVIARARVHGVSAVTVRDAFHFGAGAYWARQMARQGMVGMAFSNTRPLMPAPGGAERVVGNNPLCLAFPSSSGGPLVMDMATSASAMGKIRVAAAQGASIPPGWATDEAGNETTSPAAAIKGMLLPAAGPKGFGLAVAIDLLCGALSGGGVGGTVRPLYGDPSEPYNCAHTFIALDASRLNGGQGIAFRVDAFADVIRASRRAPGAERVYAPGDLERSRREQGGSRCALPAGLAIELDKLAAQHALEPLVSL